MRATDSERFFTDAINQLYAEDRTEHLATLRRLIEELYPAGRALNDFQRQRIAEASVRTVYVHAHMDEDTFDCSRAMLCPDFVSAEPGRLIPACTYGLFHRTQDQRFDVCPARGEERARAQGRTGATRGARPEGRAVRAPRGPGHAG